MSSRYVSPPVCPLSARHRVHVALITAHSSRLPALLPHVPCSHLFTSPDVSLSRARRGSPLKGMFACVAPSPAVRALRFAS
ncbi:hypothetical protein EON66_01415 [archaeon]|nr:MAG: hypothetical protein EON66_01415 [archaeon]